ncbi:MAG TPA: YetF domain-containing protein [Rhizomicrobium sp.]
MLFGVKDHITLGQECARAVLIFFYGLVALRISGKRTFARWSALDMVISIIVGSNLSRALTGGAPLGGTLAAVAVLVAMHLICSFAAAHSQWWSHVLEGSGVTLGEGGTVDERRLKQHLISREDLREALRQKGVERVDQTKHVTLEANGKISVLHKVDPIEALGAIAEGLAKEGRKPGAPYEDFRGSAD